MKKIPPPRLFWLFRSKPTSLSFPSQIAILVLCQVLGYLTSLWTSEGIDLGPYLAMSYAWMFGIVLFSDLGGFFNDSARHLTFWMLFMPSKLRWLLNLWGTFILTALIYSSLTVIFTIALPFFAGGTLPILGAIPQAILHQTLGLTLVAVLNYTIGCYLSSGLRQMICLTGMIALFFLSSMIPYFFSLNSPIVTFIFELIPRIDLYDNRNSLVVAQTYYSWMYTFWIALYALSQFLLTLTFSWWKLNQEGWR